MKRLTPAVMSVVVVVAAVLLVAMSLAVHAKNTDGFWLASVAFEANAKIPAKYGCGPERNWRRPSVPLHWNNPPENTKSFVLLMDDLHPVAKYWVHWLVTDIPGTARMLTENADASGLPPGSKQLKNSFGDTAYGGPCPPKGVHAYRFRLYAMPTESTALDITGKNGDALGKELEKTALGVASLSAEYP